MKLTIDDIKKATYTEKNNSRCILWDNQVLGFGLRLYTGGRKAFLLSYRFSGRKRLMTLGTFGVLTLDS